MKRLIMLMGAAALLGASWLAPSALAGGVIVTLGNIDNGRAIFENGLGDDVPACASCHGMGGTGSDDTGTPRLAYQVQNYIWKQLEDFASGKRNDNIMFQMNDIASALTTAQRRDVASYVHSLKTPFSGSNLAQLREDGIEIGESYKGKVMVNYGLPERGISACMSCHAFNGRSAGGMYPAISGQRYTYLVSALEAFRLGATTSSSEDEAARDNDPLAQMRKIAAQLTDEDIANVATFLTSAKDFTAGNPKAPAR